MKLQAPIFLSFNGGYVDTAGFLALQGLFTAHVTGNFVTFGASLAHGADGAISKLLALPVFCLVILVTRTICTRFGTAGLPTLRAMIAVKAALLVLAAALALAWGPFNDPDSLKAIVTGMTFVCAMAIQNAAHRVHLVKSPPSTLMTGTTTQVMLDLADLMEGGGAEPKRQELYGRLGKMIPSILAFAAGCMGAALLFILFGLKVFLLPPLVALITLVALYTHPDPDIL